MNCLQLTCQIMGTFFVFTTVNEPWLSLVAVEGYRFCYRSVLILCGGGSVESCRNSNSEWERQLVQQGSANTNTGLPPCSALFVSPHTSVSHSSKECQLYQQHKTTSVAKTSTIWLWQCLQCFPEGPEMFISHIFNNFCWRQHSAPLFSALYF